jgi:hypothetical protein
MIYLCKYYDMVGCITRVMEQIRDRTSETGKSSEVEASLCPEEQQQIRDTTIGTEKPSEGEEVPVIKIRVTTCYCNDRLL